MELVVNVPFPPTHEPLVHVRVTVVLEPLSGPSIVFSTVTVQVTSVVAPVGPPLNPLHSLTAMGAALAEDAGRTSPAMENVLMPTTKDIAIARRTSRKGRRGKARAKDESVLLIKPDASGMPGPVLPLLPAWVP